MKKIFVILFLASCSCGWAQKKQTPYVLLVSFDAFRYDYVEKFDLKNFKKFIKSGSQAEGLLPSFPSKTFPNHYTIVTGLYPGNHGLVDNTFYDPQRQETFTRRDKKIALDPYYYGGTPIWLLAKKSGMRVAPYYWVGSEVVFDGIRPDYNDPYADTTSSQYRIDKIVNWLKLPESERPHFLTLYFSLVDNAGHNYGLTSPEMMRAIKEADDVVGKLMDGIKSTHLPVNIIIVSDHGMKELTDGSDTYIRLNDALAVKSPLLKVINSGTHAHIYIDDKSKVDSVYQVLKKNQKNFTVYKAEQFPERWHYANPRAGDILVTAEPGKEIILEEGDKKSGHAWGEHGYDPDRVSDMKGIFYASGPNIKQGMNLPVFRNIHIYPFLAEILGLKAPSVDGSIKTLQDLYKP